MIGKIEKAHRYVEDRGRFEFTELRVNVHGDNSDHTVGLRDGQWTCNCDFFEHHSTCAHTMALELLLDGMIRERAQAVA